MSLVVADGIELKYDRLSIIPLGGQSEIGLVLFAFSYNGEILLVDAGACYPGTDLPGVDLLLPNTNFLEANQDRITALLLTNGHEEHSGAVAYLLNHVRIPRILAPRFVSALVSQTLMASTDGHKYDTVIDTVEARHAYHIGSFEVEWIQVNDAIADACALRLSTPEGTVIYTSSFKLDQTPVDGRHMDIARLAQIGDQGALVLLSDSAGVENPGYSPSEKAVARGLEQHLEAAEGRCLVAMNGTNTHRLQLIFDLAKKLSRKVVLFGDTLIQTAVAAAITGNLVYDRSIEGSLADLKKLSDDQVLIVATGHDGDALSLLEGLAKGTNKDLTLRRGDTVIFADEVYPGRLRTMAVVLDHLLSAQVKAIAHTRDRVHVANHASQEELKMMLAITRPRFFVPVLGEGRHIMKHAQLAGEFGMSADNIFPLRNGQILEISGGIAGVIGSVEAQAVLYNRDQGESVTTFSVNERRALSMEGVLTIACLLDSDGNLLQEPVLEGAGAGFRYARDWQDAAQAELVTAIKEVIKKARQTNPGEFGPLRQAIRELAAKSIRQRMGSKPTINVVVHEFSSNH